jgi:hypothetical protein
LVNKTHAFDYTVKSEKASVDKMREVVAESKVVVHMHTCFFDVKVKVPGQKVAVFHGGTRFRTAPEAYAKKYYNRTNLTLIQTGDLFGFGCKNETLLVPPVDTNYLEPRIRSWQHIAGGTIFAHYPRATGNGAWARGTDIIRDVMAEFESVRFWSSTDVLPWEKNIGRIGQSDVYIERLSPEVKEWGMTALEAASLGKVVVTNWAHPEPYEKVYGDCPFIIANTREELRKQIVTLMSAPGPEIHQMALEHREWVVKNHGLKPTGEYLRKVFDI